MLNSRPGRDRDEVFRTALTAAVVAGLVFGPLCLGATLPWPRCALQIAMALIGVCWLLGPQWRSALLLVPVLAILPAFLQLLPMPQFLLFAISPLARQAQELLREAGIGGRISRASMDPGATAAAAAQFFLVMTVLVAVALAAAGRVERRRIAWALGIMGIVVLGLGIAFSGAPRHRVLGLYDMTGPIREWKNPLLPRGASAGTGQFDQVAVGNIQYAADAPTVGNVCGPYASSNHFAGFIEMTLPVALALILGAAGSARRGRWALFGAAAALGVAGFLAVALVARSRAGTGALVLGGFFGLTAFLRGGRLRLALRLLAIAGIVAALIFADELAARARHAAWLLDSGREAAALTLDSSARHRLDAWKTAAQMAAGSPVLGIGLGAFGTLEPHFQSDLLVLYYAHNDYVQFLAETGAAGLAAFGGILWLLLRNPRKRGKPGAPAAMESAESSATAGPDRLLRAGLLAAVAAMAFHSLFDYNLHIPANAFTFAVVCGLFLGGRRAAESPGAESSAPPKDSRPALRYILLAVLALCALGVVKNLAVESRAAPLRAALVGWRLSPPLAGGLSQEAALRDKLAAAESAARMAPWDAELCDLIAQGFIQLGRGRNPADLSRARGWLADKLRLCPLDDGDRRTVGRIDAELRAPPAAR